MCSFLIAFLLVFYAAYWLPFPSLIHNCSFSSPSQGIYLRSDSSVWPLWRSLWNRKWGWECPVCFTRLENLCSTQQCIYIPLVTVVVEEWKKNSIYVDNFFQMATKLFGSNYLINKTVGYFFWFRDTMKTITENIELPWTEIVWEGLGGRYGPKAFRDLWQSG